MFIKSAAAFSSQPAGKSENGHYLAVEPEYGKWLNPGQVRRMNRLVKLGVCTAFEAMETANVDALDGITVGTGFGAFEDSDKFLTALVQSDEGLLSPTPFIQSTHNSVAAQIALLKNCSAINSTHSNGGHSFENSLIEARILLSENKNAVLLAGGLDELTPNQIKLIQKTALAEGRSGEVSIGEGGAFFVLLGDANGALAQINAIQIWNNPSLQGLKSDIQQAFSKIGLLPTDISRLYLGLSGNKSEDALLAEISSDLFLDADTILFKKNYGEFHTVSALALNDAVRYIEAEKPMKPVLILNQFRGRQYSLMMVS